MKTNNKILISSLIAGLFVTTSPSFAADARWTGLKVGVTLGGVSNKAQVENDGASFHVDDYIDDASYDGSSWGEVGGGWNSFGAGGIFNDLSGFTGDNKKNIGESNVFGGIDLTLDYQINDKFVMGLVANYDINQKKKANASVTGNVTELYDIAGGNGDSTFFNSAASVENYMNIEDSAAVGLRFGYLATPDTLLYLSGGLAATKVKTSSTYRQAGSVVDNTGYDPIYGTYSQETTASSQGWEKGHFLGAGLQTMLSSNISFKVEYRYTDYGSISTKTSEVIGSVDDSLGLGEIGGVMLLRTKYDDFHQNSVRASLVYSF